MTLKKSLSHAWQRLKHLNVLRRKSTQQKNDTESQQSPLMQNRSRDYQNSKPDEHIHVRQPNTRGERSR